MPKCTMCKQDAPNEFGNQDISIQPMGGLHIIIHAGYGMMTDPIDQTSLKALSNICLCHDCSVKFIDQFPQEFKDNFFTSGHPVEICRQVSINYMGGCHYSWA